MDHSWHTNTTQERVLCDRYDFHHSQTFSNALAALIRPFQIRVFVPRILEIVELVERGYKGNRNNIA